MSFLEGRPLGLHRQERIEVTADRKAGRFFVDAVHEDVPFTPQMTAAVDAEITALAAWLGLPLER